MLNDDVIDKAIADEETRIEFENACYVPKKLLTYRQWQEMTFNNWKSMKGVKTTWRR